MNAIYLSRRGLLIGSIFRVVRDAQTAEDIAQESYLRVAQAIRENPVEHVQAFLFQTARNLALDHARRQAARRLVEADPDSAESRLVMSPAPPADQTLIDRERLAALETVLGRLPERARRVFTLSRLDGWSYPRIGEALGVSPNTVYNDMKLAMSACIDAIERFDRR
ncbi:sigma-70 family RNA polymerase sigma factor [Methylopila sp. 73B]|uniref:RNA polymerase sigma factor n=1 Tax=Methylopila sp. 73B TaxID=1120792 RepID=UPI001FDA9FEF|nr:sigma-70 family RNA polymerase sigma factor [Methylopila sp. 73B]